MTGKSNHRRSEGVEDLILLENISEDAVANNLEQRFRNKDIYTYIGEVLVEVNPYQLNSRLYDSHMVQKYHNRMLYENQPHVYAIADECVRSLQRTGQNQCVVISGESGAGKTEASKSVMHFIAATTTTTSGPPSIMKKHSKHEISADKKLALSEEVEKVKGQLLQSNPVLEAFGNAKTVRNDNSSRFGKYMDIHFDRVTGFPIGGNLTSYLLEKSRVVSQAKGERNFHIFYQMLSGLPESILVEQLSLCRDAGKYKYLNGAAVVTDKAQFKETEYAMRVVGFSKEEVDAIYKVCAGILHLGNVEFEDLPEDASKSLEKGQEKEAPECKVKSETQSAFNLAADLLGCSTEALCDSLLFNFVAAGNGEVFQKPHNAEKAYFAREAMAQALYERLFGWIVKMVDARISCEDEKDAKSIGVLDIYGFEIFGHNGFEQFCINYCNEKLQQLFIELVLKKEQEEYEREGITWTHIDYFNNEVIVDLIEKKHIGILSILDEQCYLPGNPTDKDFLEQMNRKVGKHAHYDSQGIDHKNNFKKIEHNQFVLKHYAGNVSYSSDGFIIKNKNTLFQDIKRTFFSSSLKLCHDLFPDGAQKVTEVTKRPVTAGSGFKASLIELTKALTSKQPHYIRCIKPNDNKQAGVFDKSLVKHQIRYLGLVENIRVRRAGFAYRMNYEVFLARYKMICPSTWPNWTVSSDPKEGVEALLKHVNIPSEEYALGKSKLFIRNPTTFYKLLDLRDEKMPFVVTIIQKHVRGHLCRLRLLRQRAAFAILQKFRKYKLQEQLEAVRALYHNAGAMKDFGKSLKWPTCAESSAVGKVLYRIFRCWWAHQMIFSLSPPEQKMMRLKTLGYSVFSGKKPSWGFKNQWLGDYLSRPEYNAHAEAYQASIKSILSRDKGSEVLFSSHAVKLDRKGKTDMRAIVLTTKGLYKLNPNKAYKSKHAIKSLKDVVGVSMTSCEDDTLVVHFRSGAGGDLVFNLDNFNGSHSAELAVLIKFTCLCTCHNRIPINVLNTISFSHGGSKNLSVERDQSGCVSSIGFRKSSKGISVVLPSPGSVVGQRT
eukprot:Nk52_evm80s151 gene=Nk52_evmTU80s151